MVTVQEALAVPDFRNPELAADRLHSIVDALRHHYQIAMVVEASSHCDLACSFCAAHSALVPDKLSDGIGPVTKPEKHMKAATFASIVNKLKGQRQLKMLFFHGNGEPLLNPQLEGFVRSAKSAGIANAMTVVTNGTLLNANRMQSLVVAGISIIRVSLDFISPDTYRRVKGVDRAGRVVANLESCIDEIRAHRLPVKMSIECKEWRNPGEQDEDSLIVEHFAPLIHDLENVTIRKTREHNWIEQANKEAGLSASYRRTLPCEQPFYMLMVHSDGDLSVCCVDSKKELLLGNIDTAPSLQSILNSEKLREWRGMHLRGDFSELPACRHCDLASAVDRPLFDRRESIMELLAGTVKVV